MHYYLGMDLDVGTCLGTMMISMIKYLQKINDEFPETLREAKACHTGEICSKCETMKTGNSSVRKRPSNSTKQVPSSCFSASE